MRILIAPDKFKGSLSASQVCQALAEGIKQVRPAATVIQLPMADGGEGTLDAALACGFTARPVIATGPLGAKVSAQIGVSGESAVVEMALASGLALVAPDERDALTASSYGTGELLRAALDLGAKRIFLAIGGSASTDGGAGMLQALGARFLDAAGAELPGGGAALNRLDSVDLSCLDRRLEHTEIILANDVAHPLLGRDGAAQVFGPQKGADQAAVKTLDAGLTRLRDSLEAALPGSAQYADSPGAGAAGGVGFTALAVLKARPRPGIEVVMEFTGFAEHLATAQMVITGEGSFDEQSLGGKTPVGVARAAQAQQIPTVIVCGCCSITQQQWTAAGFAACYAIADLAPDADSSMRNASTYLHQIGSTIAKQQLP